jgi:hypothetical protein
LNLFIRTMPSVGKKMVLEKSLKVAHCIKEKNQADRRSIAFQ